MLGMLEAFNGRDFDTLGTFIAEDMKRHCAATPDLVVENRQQFLDFLRQELVAVPDARIEVNFLIVQDNLGAGHMVYKGTQTGQMGPFPPTGKTFELPFIGIQRIEDGAIKEMWVEWDNLSILTQLGHFPPPGPENGGTADEGKQEVDPSPS